MKKNSSPLSILKAEVLRKESTTWSWVYYRCGSDSVDEAADEDDNEDADEDDDDNLRADEAVANGVWNMNDRKGAVVMIEDMRRGFKWSYQYQNRFFNNKLPHWCKHITSVLNQCGMLTYHVTF